MRLNVVSVFVIVVVAASIGMVLGGVVGYAAESVAPGLFEYVTQPPHERMEHGYRTTLPTEASPMGDVKDLPQPEATMVAASVVGVFIGMGLGVFGIFVQVISQAIARRRGGDAGTPA